MKQDAEPGAFGLSVIIYVVILIVTELFIPRAAEQFIESFWLYRASYGAARYGVAYWLAFWICRHRALKKAESLNDE